VVRFDGGSVSHIEDLAGVQNIALVLQQKLAGKPDLKPTELAYLRYRPEAQREKGQLEEAELEEALPELESRDKVVPLRIAKIVKNKIAEIDAKLERASSTEIDDLLDEKTKCQQYLASGRVKPPGADRSYGQAVFPDKYKKARDAVRKAIKEATDKMAADKALAPLDDHLPANIKIGTTASYVGSLAWTVEPGVFPRRKS
jgi:hypothetical protein